MHVRLRRAARLRRGALGAGWAVLSLLAAARFGDDRPCVRLDESGTVVPCGARARPAAAPIVGHRAVDAFLDLSPAEIAAAAALRVLFVDHSVGQNISDGLDCMAFPSLEAAPSRCRRFAHVAPELSADPARFRFGAAYDRSAWTYHAGAPSYWREWPEHVAGLLGADPPWDVVIPMPSYLVGPNGGWEPIEALETAYPDVVFVYATTSLPRGAAGGTASDRVMERFNEDARAYAVAHGKPLLDVADLLSHDYAGAACFDTRDGVPYCQTPDRCEDLPDDGADIPAICQHYTSELHGGHLGSVSGGALRMAQAMWLLMARLAAGGPAATATAGPPSQTPDAASATPSAASPPTAPATGTAVPAPPAIRLPWLGAG